MNNVANILQEGNTMKALTKLGIPIIIAMLVMAIYNVVDTFWVARLGTLPVAAVSVVFPLSLLFLGIGLMFGVGGGVYISHLLGAKQVVKAGRFRLGDYFFDIGYFRCPCMQCVPAGHPVVYGSKRGNDALGRSIRKTFHHQLCHRGVECVNVQYHRFAGCVENICVGNDHRLYRQCRIRPFVYLHF